VLPPFSAKGLQASGGGGELEGSCPGSPECPHGTVGGDRAPEGRSKHFVGGGVLYLQSVHSSIDPQFLAAHPDPKEPPMTIVEERGEVKDRVARRKGP
jgi:hypothetical protein